MKVTLVSLLALQAECWISSISQRPFQHHQKSSSTTRIYTSTPFEIDYYGDDELINPYLEDASPLRVPPDTKLVLGINKYSHDTSICAADAGSGEVLFAMSKERLTRKKHDSGNAAGLVEKCLECLNLEYDSIQKVVVNNHHHRVLPIEQSLPHMEWESGLGINGGSEDGYEDDYNTLPKVDTKHEISHHLAHAYSVAAQSPFDNGLVVIMDGMGETYRTMMRATQDPTYTSDFSLQDDIEIVPSDLKERSQNSYFDWREAESVYTFTKTENDINIVVSGTTTNISYVFYSHDAMFVYTS